MTPVDCYVTIRGHHGTLHLEVLEFKPLFRSKFIPIKLKSHVCKDDLSFWVEREGNAVEGFRLGGRFEATG